MALLAGKLRPLRISVPLVLAGLGASIVIVAPGPAAAAQEGVRDCGDVRSISWVHYIDRVDDVDEYTGNQWFVYGGVGLQPSCKFAKKWAKVGVREASGITSFKKKRVKKHPPGWKCTASRFPDPVKSSGGLLVCKKYKKGKLIGSFSAGPDFNTQQGPF